MAAPLEGGVCYVEILINVIIHLRRYALLSVFGARSGGAAHVCMFKLNVSTYDLSFYGVAAK